jgi:hypothetical protein
MSDTHLASPPASSSPTPTTAPTSTSPPAVNPGSGAPAGAAPAAFYEGFGDKGLAANRSVTKFNSAEELAQGYVNLEARFGVPAERRVDLPEDMTNAEQMRGVWTKLGLPEKADGYGFKLGPEATAADTAMLGRYIEQAHKVGLPTAQAREMLDWWVGMNAEAQAAQAQQLTDRRAAGEAELKAAFGNAYEARMREATNLLARYDPQGKTGLKADQLTTFPAWTQMLIRMAERMAEPEGGQLPGGFGEGGGERPLTPAQAQAQLAAFNLDGAKQQALFNDKHPSHAAVLAERTRLLEAANPRPGTAR